MAILSNRVPEPKLFSSWGREPSSSPPLLQSSATGTETARPSRYVLPQDLNTGVQQLDDPPRPAFSEIPLRFVETIGTVSHLVARNRRRLYQALFLVVEIP
jgi:hypothetical protein